MRTTARHIPFNLRDEAEPLVKRHIFRCRGFQPAGQPFGVGHRGLRAYDPAAMALALMLGTHAHIVKIPEAPLGPVGVDARLRL